MAAAMATQCSRLQLALLIALLLALPALFTRQQAHALEFMDVDKSPDPDIDDTELDSAELPPILHNYSKDTIANFNPRKMDTHFRALWEHVPQQKPEVIKRR